MSDQKTAKEYIQDARVKLMDKFGIFGGGHELNAVFDSLNKAYEILPESCPITSDKELIEFGDFCRVHSTDPAFTEELLTKYRKQLTTKEGSIMEYSYEWVLRCISSSTDEFHLECCRALVGLFIVQYGAIEFALSLQGHLALKTKEIHTSERDE